ncbi:hypothetical protein GGX14DRAFT_394489 [Mycena pura]|uniref:Uncharacterized protein n=1 Tax=Mycena pura TaxID=153505 RepID=A0AAD6VIY4_9AGAR|nr:hypothetical protein GGX14DRAFT_394489 [Mycena pura]
MSKLANDPSGHGPCVRTPTTTPAARDPNLSEFAHDPMRQSRKFVRTPGNPTYLPTYLQLPFGGLSRVLLNVNQESSVGLPVGACGGWYRNKDDGSGLCQGISVLIAIHRKRVKYIEGKVWRAYTTCGAHTSNVARLSPVRRILAHPGVLAIGVAQTEKDTTMTVLQLRSRPTPQSGKRRAFDAFKRIDYVFAKVGVAEQRFTGTVALALQTFERQNIGPSGIRGKLIVTLSAFGFFPMPMYDVGVVKFMR